MNEENEKRFEEVQPNSTQRLEFLIVMEYLKKYAYDKEHATTQKEIVDFAEKEYGAYIRRDRVGQILIHLEQLSRNNPELLPFTLRTVELNKIKKYYVPQRMFTDAEIIKIISALNCDNNLHPTEVESLKKKFLDVAANDNQQANILDRVAKRGKEARDHIDTNLLNKRELFLRAVDKQYRIFFRLKKAHRNTEYSSFPREVMKTLTEKKEPVKGFAAMTYLVGDELRAVIYMDEIQTALITTFDNIIVDKWFDLLDFNNGPLNMVLRNKQYRNIVDWLDAHYKGQDGLQQTYKCKVTINGPLNFEKFKREFHKYWKKDLEYEVVDRIVPLTELGERGELHVDYTVAHDAIFNIESNRSSFDHWYIDEGNFDEVVILEPKRANEYFLKNRIERYVRRLNKYGECYNYYLSSEMRPEYAKEREEAEKRYQEFKERARQRREQAKQDGNK